MLKLCGFLTAACAVIVFSGAARAEDKVLLALNTPVKISAAPLTAELMEPATAQLKTGVTGYTDFDAFSAVDDPLYREGSKELLKQIMKNDAEKKNAAKESMRDAPISKGAQRGAAGPVKARPLMNKIKAGRPLHTDPIKAKDTF